jgi:dCTP deaminase
MPVKSDRWIIEMSREQEMIKPFAESQVRTGISFGTSSYGYDFRLSDEFKIIDSRKNITELDPAKMTAEHFRDVKADSILIEPNSFVLGRTVEYFKIPRDILTICFGKSTYARIGVIVNVTPFEPEWEGFATISLTNSSPLPARVYANQGIAQLLFLEAAEVCVNSYRDKKGKYQAQKNITISKAD